MREPMKVMIIILELNSPLLIFFPFLRPSLHIHIASGGIPSPFDSYLANRGLKTLHIRMREHQKSAMAVAKFLESSPHVQRVIYPGLPSHPEHEILKRQCKGFGGMVTFIINGTMDNAIKFFQAIKVQMIV